MLGSFGDIIFETSDKRLLNFEGFKRDTASVYENHKLMGQKPRTEFVAPGLDTVTFTVILRSRFGVKPRDEMNRWLEYARSGNAETLEIGGRALGVDKWVVTSASQHWDTMFNRGELISGKVDVTLQEYVSTMWTVKAYQERLERLEAGKADDTGKDGTPDNQSGGYNENKHGSLSPGQVDYFDPELGEFIKLLDEFVSTGSESGSTSFSDSESVENLYDNINVPGMTRPVLLFYIRKKLEEATGYLLLYSHQYKTLSISRNERKYEVPARCVLVCDLEIVDALKILEALEGVANE